MNQPQSVHPQPSVDSAELRQSLLSSLADGELDQGAAARGCGLWRDDSASRADWHAYHLIGDVMRRDDLATLPRGDAAFVAKLRQRLASEPPIVAPTPMPMPTLARQRWLAPAAIAAGLMAVAGVVVVTRMSAPTPAAPLLAAGQAAPTELRRVGNGASAPSSIFVDADLIRDAQIDQYLRAHREMSGGRAAAVPGGVLRSVDTIVPQR